MMMYKPIAISVQELRENIIECLQAKYDDDDTFIISIPSEEWIRLQFWPKNTYAKTAIQYSHKYFLARIGV